jgi:hypothetical protein
MTLPHLRVLLASLLLVSACVESAIAAEPKKTNWAATELAQVDEDFPFQGEYVGTAAAGGVPQSVGMQVVALGSGKFDAVVYPGGLPGAGWTLKDRIVLHGARDRSSASLTGVGFAAIVANDAATLSTSDGRAIGTLRKTYRRSATEGRVCPDNGSPLYTDAWKQGFKNAKRTKERLLAVGTETKWPLRDYTMHVEFKLPYMPYARGQGRSNSGVYLQGRYEVQILDSFGLEGKNNECGSLYTYHAPDVNMCYPPLAWQTYDIAFRSPRFDESGVKIENGRLSVWHNGVAVQNNFEIERKTGAGQPEGPRSLPIKLQDHGNPVVFRNIWMVDHDQPMPEPVPVRGPEPFFTKPAKKTPAWLLAPDRIARN